LTAVADDGEAPFGEPVVQRLDALARRFGEPVELLQDLARDGVIDH